LIAGCSHGRVAECSDCSLALRAAAEAFARTAAEQLGADMAAAAAEALEVLDAGNAARAQRATTPTRAPRFHEKPRPAALPQNCPPPKHVPGPSKERARECERVARASARRARPGDRNEVIAYWAPWVRPWFRRAVESVAQCSRELLAVRQSAPWWHEQLELTAAAYGGKRTPNGRHVIAYGALIYWHARNGNTALSGLPLAAWASLSVSPSAREPKASSRGAVQLRKAGHYSTGALAHRCHDYEGELVPLDVAEGPQGGRFGAGANCGILAALERDGLIRSIQPDAREAPRWLVGPKGWAFCQVLVRFPVERPEDLPHDAADLEAEAAAKAAKLEAMGVHVPVGPP
jgi:hypothetical protein